MGVVQTSLDQIIRMAAVRNGRVTAVRPVFVPGAASGGLTTLRRIRVDFDGMFVHMITMGVMQMPVMQVIGVAVMTDRDVTAALPVFVGVLPVLMFCTCHLSFSIRGCNEKTAGTGNRSPALLMV